MVFGDNVLKQTNKKVAIISLDFITRFDAAFKRKNSHKRWLPFFKIAVGERWLSS